MILNCMPAFAGLLLLLPGRMESRAQDCRLPMPEKPAFLEDTLRLEVTCPGGSAPLVAWDFGDGSPPTDYSSSLVGTHVYAQPGFYTLFARFKDQDIPATGSIMVVHRPTPTSPTHSSTILFDPARRRVWAVNPDNGSVTAVDAATRKRLFEAPAGGGPRTLALGPDGNIWVTSQDDAAVAILDGRDGKRLADIPLPFASRPYGIAFDPAGKRAYVSLEATGRLIRIDPVSRSVTGSLFLGPTPRGIAVSHDGRRVLVTRHISAMAAAGAADYGEVWEVDGLDFTLKRTFRLDADTATDRKDNSRGVPNALSSITITPDGRQALVPCTKANSQKGLALDGKLPTFETSLRTVVARIDLIANREDMATRKDVDNRSLASSITFDRMGRFAYLTTHGTNKTLILQGPTLRNFSVLATPLNDAAALLRGESRELAPIGSVLDGRDSLLFVHYLMSREIGVYDAASAGQGDSIAAVTLIRAVERDSLPLQVLVGKRIFHNGADARMGKEGYISCAACHLDGSGDGRVWDFTDRGEGLRRTTSLLGRAGMDHGPVHWSANFDEIQDFEHDMRGPFAGEGFMDPAAFNQGTRNKPLGDRKAGLSPELDALAAYVSSLERVRPSPFRNPDGSMTAEALAGKLVFQREDVGCAKCHAAPRYTDSRLPVPGAPITPGSVSIFSGAASHYTQEGFLLHDVGTLKPASGKRLGDTLRGLDTPTLKGIWEGGPYLHDGSAASLEDAIFKADAGDRHGKTSHLSEGERGQLLAFLGQLDDLDEQGRPVTQAIRPSRSGGQPRLTAHVIGGQVRIGLRMPRASNGMTVSIVNLHGQLVREFRGAGNRREWTFIWDGLDRSGRRAGVGLFMLRAEASPALSIPAHRFFLP